MLGRASRRALGSAVAISIALHLAAVAVAVLAFGRHAPAAEDPAAITVFVPPVQPAPPAVETSESKPAPEPPPLEPPPPEPPLPDFAPPPPEEALAVPDFKPPPPPPPPVKPPPPRPKPAPARPPIAAAPQPAPAPVTSAPPTQAVPPVAGAPAPTAAPGIVPNWNVQLAAWLAAHKNYPNASRQRGEQGEVLIRFTVEDNGRVSAVSVDKGSGHADLDAAALRMLQGATLPPPGATATRTVRIRYRLDD
jgi:protein TonB